ncbi:MAG: hypothetical protein KBF82_03735 [Chitinophagaceae bacterium]|nr:hypothetical protein [Chitinophagaceae bacterium]
MLNIKNRDNLLGVAAAIAFLIGSANALEYFIAGKNYLSINKGVVEKLIYERYEGRRNMLYSKTTIRLKEMDKNFYLSDNANDGGYIETSEGEIITLYARKWYQNLYNFNYRDNIYYVEKDGQQVYNNLDTWKASAFTYMCIAGGSALLLLVMYLDQAKNISITNWFEKRRLNKRKAKLN